MSSSSSDSDSDDYEPIRRIRINIKPKSSIDSTRSTAATIQELKASVESWRPLGPLPHPSLSRRQSSLSSVSSMSMYGLQSSPSCSSLVNEFNNRSAFSNVMSSSRTSSPLTVINHGDTIPIAVAIQESIELLIRGTTRRAKIRGKLQNNIDKMVLSQTEISDNQFQEEHLLTGQESNFDGNGSNHDTQIYKSQEQDDYDANFAPEFTTRSMGNLKLAFPNAFAKGVYGKPTEPLRFCLKTTENIMKYYASRLIKDFDKGVTKPITAIQETCNNHTPHNYKVSNDSHKRSDNNMKGGDHVTPRIRAKIKTSLRFFELDMDLLMTHLRKLNEQSPTSSYYNVDVLRYQIAPINVISRCPLQICAYWRLEPGIIKLRIDFKHSSESGISLDRLREISICVDLSDLLSSTENYNITTKPKAHWNRSIEQLNWKFESLESYQDTEGLGSLYAKIHHQSSLISQDVSQDKLAPYPNPIDVKFLVVDSTLSKVGFSIDSAGYKMTLLKREIRSGRYRCEPYIIL